ncbi:MAG: DNA gyrase subunit A [Anaerolineae bacterium]|nr:DNA gyrase subunit A [Anaerolineae bacterium]
MEIGIVRQVDINTKVKHAYLDYAMSVIVSRALPDVRDGLKPVQRRILYAMHDMGIRPGTPYKKSARIVGEVLGKYHPHGDSAVYDAMARLAQDFSMRYPVVDGQGNFGSIDGDAPAAMRYTEARMASVALDLLTDIDKDTVDWSDNFDGTLKEPIVLPSRLPNLLINGSSGIAVGMSTNIPPHNLGEVIDACVHLLNNWEQQEDIAVEDLMEFITGPDFPTGGLVYRRDREDGENALLKAYATGRGRVTVRARAHLEEAARGRQRIVITEIPYQINKGSLIEGIAKYVRAGKIEGVADLRDESDRQGMRLVIELNQNADADEVLADLYKHTTLETRYSLILLALVNGEPRRLSLKKMLLYFLNHRLEVLVRRSHYLLEKARARAHIVEGLLIALDNLDEVIDLIRRSKTPDTAKKNLQRKFKLSEVQAQAILDMQLRRLAALERKKLKDEYKELLATIEDLEALLASPKRQRDIIRDDILALKDQYSDTRRTHILDVKGAKVVADALTPDEPVWVTASRSGIVGRVPDDGKAPPRVNRSPEDAPLALISASTRDTLYLFTKTGNAVALPVHQLPDGVAWDGHGASWGTLTRGQDGALVAALTLPSTPPEGGMVMFATAQGKVKRLSSEELPGVGLGLAQVLRLDAGDTLVGVVWVAEEDEVVLASSAGQGIRFSVSEVRPSGAKAGGISGIRLDKEECLTGITKVVSDTTLLTVSSNANAKRCEFDSLPTQRRGGKGVLIARLAGGETLVGIGTVAKSYRFFPVTNQGGAKTTVAQSTPELGRTAAGDSCIALQGSEKVATVVVFAPRLRG